MAITYELWNVETGNLVGAFESEGAALETVRKAIRTHGLAYVDSLLLGREDDDGRSEKIAAGAALAELSGAGPESDGGWTSPSGASRRRSQHP